MNMAFLGPRLTVEEIFKDYRGRRIGVIRALTVGNTNTLVSFFSPSSTAELSCHFLVSDDDKVYYSCGPADKRDLCLYGNPDKTWEVKPPPSMIPPSIPDPRLAINVARDVKGFTNWIDEIALYTHPWLLSVAFYFAARLNSNERKRLFDMIKNLPTVMQMVSRFQRNRNKTNMVSGSKYQRITTSRYQKIQCNQKLARIAEDDEELCGSCGIDDHVDKFWIACDTCNRWFHGACVYVTPEKAKRIGKYKCPLCNVGGSLD